MPKIISIITICYNRVSSIEFAIRSVLQQSYTNIEYIIVDGNSTDGTKDIIEKYKDQLSAYISEPDNGMYEALNKAIKLATGDVIGILHSDDVFYNSDTIKLYVDEYEKSNADILYAKGQYVSKINKIEKVKRVYKSSNYHNWFLYFGWIPLHTTIFVKRDLFDKYGLYNEKYHISSDYEISLRWFSAKELKKHYIDEWTVKMLLGGKSTSASLQIHKSTEDLEIIKQFKLFGIITLFFKIARKIPQYVKPLFVKYN